MLAPTSKQRIATRITRARRSTEFALPMIHLDERCGVARPTQRHRDAPCWRVNLPPAGQRSGTRFGAPSVCLRALLECRGAVWIARLRQGDEVYAVAGQNYPPAVLLHRGDGWKRIFGINR